MYLDDPDPLMPLHLSSRATRLGDLAVALYAAVDDVGLRLPSRRDIARHSRISEATVCRRFREVPGGEEQVAGVLASARERTFPPGWPEDGWSRWIPGSDTELQDAGVWIACLAMAAYTPSVAEVVRHTWERELEALVRQLTGVLHLPGNPCDPEVALDAQVLLAVVVGLTIRRRLDPEVTAEQALVTLRRALAALGHGDG